MPDQNTIREETLKYLRTKADIEHGTSVPEIERRLHRPGTLDNKRSAAIDFFGAMIRADYRDSRHRRVSPRALSVSLHHHAIWDLRVFSIRKPAKP
jgi:hypothetical protein